MTLEVAPTNVPEHSRSAPAQGYAKAQFNLGVMYEQGDGLEVNKTKAFELYAKAAAQGFAVAQLNFGVMYETGDGVRILPIRERVKHNYDGQARPRLHRCSLSVRRKDNPLGSM